MDPKCSSSAHIYIMYLRVGKRKIAISDALAAAERINTFLGGGLDLARMATAVEPALHRMRGLPVREAFLS